MSTYHKCRFCGRKHLGLSPQPSEICIRNLKRDISRFRNALIDLEKSTVTMKILKEETIGALQVAREYQRE